jgi:RNA polymerase sigma factor for flagellar operon FliA
MERFFRSRPPEANGCRREKPRAGASSKDRRQRERKFDALATREIVSEFGHIVKFMAHKLSYNLPGSMEESDLVSVGLVGLMDAAERFDPSRGFKFATFAEFRVRGAMLDELRRQDWLPRGARERVREFETKSIEFKREHGRAPTSNELGKIMGLPTAKIEALEQNGGGVKMVRYENLEPDEAKQSSEIDDVDSPYDLTARKDIRRAMEKVIHDLPERLQHILVLYYFEELSLKEIGVKMSITESRVSQLHTRAVTSLKKLVAENQDYAELRALLNSA